MTFTFHFFAPIQQPGSLPYCFSHVSDEYLSLQDARNWAELAVKQHGEACGSYEIEEEGGGRERYLRTPTGWEKQNV